MMLNLTQKMVSKIVELVDSVNLLSTDIKQINNNIQTIIKDEIPTGSIYKKKIDNGKTAFMDSYIKNILHHIEKSYNNLSLSLPEGYFKLYTLVQDHYDLIEENERLRSLNK